MLPWTPWPTVRRLDAASVLPLNRARGRFRSPFAIPSTSALARWTPSKDLVAAAPPAPNLRIMELALFLLYSSEESVHSS